VHCSAHRGFFLGQRIKGAGAYLSRGNVSSGGQSITSCGEFAIVLEVRGSELRQLPRNLPQSGDFPSPPLDLPKFQTDPKQNFVTAKIWVNPRILPVAKRGTTVVVRDMRRRRTRRAIVLDVLLLVFFSHSPNPRSINQTHECHPNLMLALFPTWVITFPTLSRKHTHVQLQQVACLLGGLVRCANSDDGTPDYFQMIEQPRRFSHQRSNCVVIIQARKLRSRIAGQCAHAMCIRRG